MITFYKLYATAYSRNNKFSSTVFDVTFLAISRPIASTSTFPHHDSDNYRLHLLHL